MQHSKISFLKRANNELVKIKQNASPSEWKRLFDNVYKLNGLKANYCIYGIMTGNCYSNRATELIQLCSVPHYFYYIASNLSNLIAKKKLFENCSSDARNYTILELCLLHYKSDVVQMIEKLSK